MKHISRKEKDDRIIFTFSVVNRSRSRKIYYNVDDILKMIKSEHDLENYNFLQNESSGVVDSTNTEGTYIFKKKTIDILNNNVKINQIKIEADAPVSKEQKKEASLTSETLPYGLKSTAKKTTTRKKRTTRKKKTEE